MCVCGCCCMFWGWVLNFLVCFICQRGETREKECETDCVYLFFVGSNGADCILYTRSHESISITFDYFKPSVWILRHLIIIPQSHFSSTRLFTICDVVCHCAPSLANAAPIARSDLAERYSDSILFNSACFSSASRQIALHLASR